MIKINSILLYTFLTLSLIVMADDKSSIIPIQITPEMREVILQSEKDIQIAILKQENIILQLRLILKVPNEFIFDKQSMTFKPQEKVEPKIEPKVEIKEPKK